MAQQVYRARHRWWYIVLAAAALSGLCWLGYVKFGHLLVIALYDGQMPIDLLNQIIKKQALHPLHYYLDKADAAARGGAILLLVSGFLLGGYTALAERLPNSLIRRPLIGGAVIATCLFWGLLILQVPLLQALPYWFWSLNDKPLPWAWIFFPLLLLAYFILKMVFAVGGKLGRRLLMLVLLGYVLQHGLALMEARGLAGLTDRLLVSGHGLYARAAVEQESLIRLLDRYEAMLQGGELPLFPHATKPPGLLLFLTFINKIALAVGGLWPGDALSRLAILGAWAFPFLSCAAALPLYFLCRLYGDNEESLTAVALFITMPNTLLITLHGDQYLYPLLGLAFVFISALAFTRQRWPWAVVAGGVFYLAMLASFALVALVPLAIVLAGVEVYQKRMKWGEAGSLVALGVLGFGVCYLTFVLAFDYDAVQRLQAAMALHQRFKIGDWHLGHRLYFGILNLVEYAVWCGLPLALLCGARIRAVAADWRRGVGALQDTPTLALLAVLLVLVAVGKTVAESGRLWIFLSPYVAMGAAFELRRWGGQRAFMALAFMQLVTALVIKSCQDFF